MANYGVRIYHPDGSHFDFSDRTTLCRVLGVGRCDYRSMQPRDPEVYTYSTGIRVPEGYDWWLWQTFNVNQNWGVVIAAGNFSGVGSSGPSFASAFLDDNRVINVRWDFQWSREYIHHQQVEKNWQISGSMYGAVAWPVAQQHSYGFQIYGVDNLSGVFDSSLVSYLMWKGETDIYDGWGPQAINPALSLYNSICFFHTTDVNAVISINSDGRYRVWRNGRKADSPVRAKVCVFGNGAPLSPEADYGMEVWNPQTGQRVYNSGRDVLMRPQIVSLSQTMRMEENTIFYSGVGVPGISRPMYAPTNTGAGVANGVAFNDQGENMSGFYTWVTSDGYFLYQRPGGEMDSFTAISGKNKLFHYNTPRVDNSTNPVMVINADDYFVF
ncbi:hypothetical protein MOR33_004046 [Salmonella enterica]|nr:hypothetical protein [Salmonella enterica]EGL7479732.1 hypothetical protein [Salmonella enterica]EIZ2335061.1 hypothetical protein [Salmonella enterica]